MILKSNNSILRPNSQTGHIFTFWYMVPIKTQQTEISTQLKREHIQVKINTIT